MKNIQIEINVITSHIFKHARREGLVAQELSSW